MKNKLANESKYMGVGIALGVAFGAAFDNIGLGIALGAAIGAALGACRAPKHKDDKDNSGN